MELCDFKATKGYSRSRFKGKQNQVVVIGTFNPSIWELHDFNPSTREVETGVI